MIQEQSIFKQVESVIKSAPQIQKPRLVVSARLFSMMNEFVNNEENKMEQREYLKLHMNRIIVI